MSKLTPEESLDLKNLINNSDCEDNTENSSELQKRLWTENFAASRFSYCGLCGSCPYAPLTLPSPHRLRRDIIGEIVVRYVGWGHSSRRARSAIRMMWCRTTAHFPHDEARAVASGSLKSNLAGVSRHRSAHQGRTFTVVCNP